MENRDFEREKMEMLKGEKPSGLADMMGCPTMKKPLEALGCDGLTMKKQLPKKEEVKCALCAEAGIDTPYYKPFPFTNTNGDKIMRPVCRLHYENLFGTVRKDPKINRNGPCPCGSGKKFKKCCFKK